jgi:ribosome-binding factor A
MKPYRMEKIAEMIRNEISLIIHRKIHDPRIKFVSIQYVELTKDMKLAKVHITTFGNLESQQKATEALNNAKGFIKAELARRVLLRFLPNIEFLLEESEPIETIQDDLE